MVSSIGSGGTSAAIDMIEAQKAKAAAEANNSENASSSGNAGDPSSVTEGSKPETVSADQMLSAMDAQGRANFEISQATSGNAGTFDNPENRVTSESEAHFENLAENDARFDGVVAPEPTATEEYFADLAENDARFDGVVAPEPTATEEYFADLAENDARFDNVVAPPPATSGGGSGGTGGSTPPRDPDADLDAFATEVNRYAKENDRDGLINMFQFLGSSPEQAAADADKALADFKQKEEENLALFYSEVNRHATAGDRDSLVQMFTFLGSSPEQAAADADKALADISTQKGG